MGQRTAILIKKNYRNKSTITLIHHQWGIGKVMHSLFLQEILRAEYNLDRSVRYDEDHLPIDDLFSFKPLNNENNNYITDMKVPKKTNVFDVDTIKEYFKRTDNNNGGLIIEVTQKYRKDYDGKVVPKTYGDMLDVKFSFVLGNEECGLWNSYFEQEFEIEEPFSRLVSAEEFARKTFGSHDEEIQKHTTKFLTGFKALCEVFRVEEVYNEKEAKRIQKITDSITTELELLEKKSKETGIRQPIPKSLLKRPLAYV